MITRQNSNSHHVSPDEIEKEKDELRLIDELKNKLASVRHRIESLQREIHSLNSSTTMYDDAQVSLGPELASLLNKAREQERYIENELRWKQQQLKQKNS